MIETIIKSNQEFVTGLSKEDKMILTLRDELYVGSFERMVQDLRYRLRDRPYNYKLTRTIEEDLARIERLQSYELKNKVNISDLLCAQSAVSA